MNVNDNIHPHVAHVLMRPLTSIMFCAHDNAQHTVCYSPVGQGWMVENHRGLVSIHENMGVALDVMRMCAETIPTQWSITDNPYA